MKMKTRFATLCLILLTGSPLLSASELERLRALCAEQELQIQQLELKIARLTDSPPPSQNVSATEKPQPKPAQASDSSTYTVKAGDNIVRIAREHGTTSTILNQLNGLNNESIIRPGQKLKIPASSKPSAEIASKPPEPKKTTNTHKHTITSGDTFYSISRKYGVSVDELIKSNPSVNHRVLKIGQVIEIVGTEKNQSPSQALSETQSIPVSTEPPQAIEQPVKITKEISYGDFAKKHRTTTQRLDELNGLQLDPDTILAQGSELYTPTQQP